MNLLALEGLPPSRKSFEAIEAAGYDGVQFVEPASDSDLAACRRLGLGIAGSGRVNEPGEALPLAERLASEGMECGTIHLGWGMEDDDVAARLIEAVLSASERSGVPLYVETHRATVFQDMWRTVQFIHRFPDLRFNGDFSHWYTGQEMVYGGFENKLAFIRPVIDRVRFMHGRIGNPGCMQVDIGDGNGADHPYVDHFRALWTAVFRSYLRSHANRRDFFFTPELLAPRIYYGRTFGGREEADRWAQSQVLVRVARECFESAQQS
jgi:sugar phosphate isomerase/epimerase